MAGSNNKSSATPNLKEFTPEDLDVLTSKGEQLLIEQEEYNATEAEQLRLESELAQEDVQLTQQRLEQVQTSTSQMQDIIKELETDAARIDEIGDSFGLQLAEVVLGPFNPKFSRRALTQEMEVNKYRMEQIARQDQMDASVINAKQVRNQAIAQQKKLTTAIEAQEVAGIASELKTNLEVRDMVTSARMAMLTQAKDDKALDLIAKNDPSMTRAVQVEKMARMDEIYKQKSQAFQLEFDNQRAMAIGLENADEESLRDGSFALAHPDVPMRMQENEITRRNNEAIATDQLNIGYQQLLDAERARTAGDEELAASDSVPDQQALENRKLQRAVNEEQLQTLMASAAKRKMDNMTTGALEETLQTALANGGTTVLPGTNQQVTSLDLDNALKMKTTVEIERAALATGTSLVANRVSRGMDELLRTLHIPNADGATPEAKLKMAIADPNLPVDVKDDLEIALTKLQLDPAAMSGTAMQNNLLTLDTMIKDLREKTKVTAIAKLPASNQKAAASFYTNGYVERNEDAIGVVTSSAIYKEIDPIINPVYAAVNDNLLSMSKSRTLGKGTQAEAAANAQKLLGDTDPSDLISATAIDSATHDELAKPILDSSMVETHIAAATKLGNLRLAEAIRSNPAFQDSEGFNQALYLQFIQDNAQQLGFDMAGYLTTYRKVMPDVIKRVTSVQGADGLIVGSYNRLLFNNDPISMISEAIEFNLDQSKTQVYKAQSVNVRGNLLPVQQPTTTKQQSNVNSVLGNQ